MNISSQPIVNKFAYASSTFYLLFSIIVLKNLTTFDYIVITVKKININITPMLCAGYCNYNWFCLNSWECWSYLVIMKFTQLTFYLCNFNMLLFDQIKFLMKPLISERNVNWENFIINITKIPNNFQFSIIKSGQENYKKFKNCNYI